MSGSAPTSSVSPSTDRAITVAVGLAHLVQTAETIPVVKADLEAQFDSISHSSAAPIILAIAGVIGSWLTGHGIPADNMILVVAVGGVVTAVGYGWQAVMIRWNKPVAAGKP